MWLKRIEVILSVLIVLMLVWGLWESRNWPFRTRLFPEVVEWPILLIALVQLGNALWKLLRPESKSTSTASVAHASDPAALAGSMGAAPTPLAVALAEAADEVPEVITDPNVIRQRALTIAFWTIGFAVGLWLLGFKVGSIVLTLIFLRYTARESWKMTAYITVGTYLTLLLGFEMSLNVPFGPGLIAQSLGLESFDWYLVNPIKELIRGG